MSILKNCILVMIHRIVVKCSNYVLVNHFHYPMYPFDLRLKDLCIMH